MFLMNFYFYYIFVEYLSFQNRTTLLTLSKVSIRHKNIYIYIYSFNNETSKACFVGFVDFGYIEVRESSVTDRCSGCCGYEGRT